MQNEISYQIPFRLKQKILMDGARVPGLVISSVLITHGYIIHIWMGYAGRDETILSGFSQSLHFGIPLFNISTSLSMMRQSGMDFYRS